MKIRDKITGEDDLMNDTYRCFLEAAKYKIYTQKEVTQTDIAKACGVTAQHINAALKQRPSRPGGKPVRLGSDLQEKIAGVFGYSLVEFFEFGRRIVEGMTEQERAALDIDSDDEPVSFAGMDGEAVLNHIASFQSDVDRDMAEISTVVFDHIFALVENRNQLYRHLQRKQKIFNTIEDCIKVVNRDKLVTYCNDSYTTCMGVGMGETCRDEDCGGQQPCIVDEVFRTKKKQSQIRMHRGRYLGIEAWPMRGSSGEVEEVAVSSRDIHDFHLAALSGKTAATRQRRKTD